MDSAVLNTHQNKMQRPQTNDNLNGPRVSFNKDVHVKRIGNNHQTYYTIHKHKYMMYHRVGQILFRICV